LQRANETAKRRETNTDSNSSTIAFVSKEKMHWIQAQEWDMAMMYRAALLHAAKQIVCRCASDVYLEGCADENLVTDLVPASRG
jgi:hypothetical protein